MTTNGTRDAAKAAAVESEWAKENLKRMRTEWDAIDAVEKGVEDGTIKLDLKGHFYGYYAGWLETELNMLLLRVRNTPEKIDILVNRHLGKRDNRTVWIEDGRKLKCNSCCENVRLKILKNKIVAESECSEPSGYPAYSVWVNIPSGKIIFGNDFRDLVDLPVRYDINRTEGAHATSKAYAEEGMFHLYVGNTCPGVYRVSDERINICSPERRGLGKADGWAEVECPPPDGREVGSICTDLWWYSAMDYNLFKKLAKKKYGKKWKNQIGDLETIVKVKPGCYRAVGQTHRVRTDGTYSEEEGSHHPEELFSYIVREGDVRELEPQSDHAEAIEFMRDFENAIAIRKMAWPSITGSRVSVLDHWFLTIGNGMDWKDGTLVSVGEKEIDAVRRFKAGERPVWPGDDDDNWDEYRRRWSEQHGKTYDPPHRTFYPISDNYSGCFTVPDNIRPDWLAGVREILHVVIDNGAGPLEDKEHERNKNNVRMAKKALRKLKERFGPEV